VAQVNLIAVENQDFLFRVGFFNLHRQDGFLDLAAYGFVRFEEQQLRQLLGERAAPFLHLQMDEIPEQRSGGSQGIDPEVMVEARVFGGNDGLNKLGGNLVVVDQDPLLTTELVGGRPIRRKEDADDRGPPVLEAGDFGDVGGEEVAGYGPGDRRQGEQYEQNEGDAEGESSRRFSVLNSFTVIIYICYHRSAV
jgi:hypothetical protein